MCSQISIKKISIHRLKSSESPDNTQKHAWTNRVNTQKNILRQFIVINVLKVLVEKHNYVNKQRKKLIRQLKTTKEPNGSRA